MAALSANTNRPYRMPPGGLSLGKLKLAGYTNRGGGSVAFKVYKGAVLCCDVTDTDGYFGPKDMNYAAGDIFGGISMDYASIDSSLTTDGLVSVSVAQNGVWAFALGSLAITDIGAVAYADTDNSVTSASTNNLPIGTIVDVDATYVWVDIEDYAMKAGS